MTKFSTCVLERALAEERERREQWRREMLSQVQKALEALSRQISFEEAYIFGSAAKPHRYFEGSDLDIAFVGLRDEDFFKASAFLSRELGIEVDVLQLEGHTLKEKILKEGIRWKR